MRGPRDLSAADGHTPVTKYQWFVNIHMCIHLLCISIFSIRRVYLYQINHTIMVSMPGISSLGHLSPENSLEQIHIATVNVYVRHTDPEPAAFCSEPTVRLLNIFIIILFFYRRNGHQWSPPADPKNVFAEKPWSERKSRLVDALLSTGPLDILGCQVSSPTSPFAFFHWSLKKFKKKKK